MWAHRERKARETRINAQWESLVLKSRLASRNLYLSDLPAQATFRHVISFTDYLYSMDIAVNWYGVEEKL